MFVEAGSDATYEQDDVYYSYFESAKLQKELAKKSNKSPHQTWSFEHYKRFQKRRFESAMLAKQMLYADDGWEKNVKNRNFD